MKQYRICFVSPKAYPYFNEKAGHSGGAEHQLFYLGTELSETNSLKISFAVADYGQAKTEQYKDVTVWNTFSFKQNKLKSFVSLIKILRKINADLYVFRAVSPNLLPVFIILKYFFRKKVIYMLASELEASPFKLKQAKSFFTWRSMEYSYRLADVIIAQNEEQKKQFVEYRKQNNVTVVRSFFKIKQQNYDKAKADKILWVGRCIPLKQPEIFISLAKEFPKESFQIVCPKHEDEKYWQVIRGKASKVPNLTFYNYVKPNELKTYYKNAKIYVITSTSEGMPNTMLEAAQYNCAVLSLNINPDDLIHKFNLGFFTKEKKELGALLKKMLSDNEKLVKFQKNGINFLNTWHNPQKVIKGFREIIEKQV